MVVDVRLPAMMWRAGTTVLSWEKKKMHYTPCRKATFKTPSLMHIAYNASLLTIIIISWAETSTVAASGVVWDTFVVIEYKLLSEIQVVLLLKFSMQKEQCTLLSLNLIPIIFQATHNHNCCCFSSNRGEAVHEREWTLNASLSQTHHVILYNTSNSKSTVQFFF